MQYKYELEKYAACHKKKGVVSRHLRVSHAQTRASYFIWLINQTTHSGNNKEQEEEEVNWEGEMEKHEFINEWQMKFFSASNVASVWQA